MTWHYTILEALPCRNHTDAPAVRICHFTCIRTSPVQPGDAEKFDAVAKVLAPLDLKREGHEYDSRS